MNHRPASVWLAKAMLLVMGLCIGAGFFYYNVLDKQYTHSESYATALDVAGRSRTRFTVPTWIPSSAQDIHQMLLVDAGLRMHYFVAPPADTRNALSSLREAAFVRAGFPWPQSSGRLPPAPRDLIDATDPSSIRIRTYVDPEHGDVTCIYADSTKGQVFAWTCRTGRIR